MPISELLKLFTLTRDESEKGKSSCELSERVFGTPRDP